MTQNNSSVPSKRKYLSAYRLTLLASVAIFGIAVIVAGPDGYRDANLPAWTTTAQAAEVASRDAGFADIVARVKPAVVAVRVRIDASAKTTNMDQNQNILPFEPGSPLEKYFRQFGLPDMPNNMPQRRQMITGEGSGFFISPDGYAVTNYHVVDHAKTVQVTTDDGKNFNAKVVGTDQKTDLALIKVEGSQFPYVQFAEHESRVGDWVIAVGNPFGLGGTVTAGIVSARGRDIGAGPYDDYIQIDAPINKGNSGGPAFDVNGKVIGVNTAIYSPSGGSVGIGFDIPAQTAKMVVAQLKDKGYVSRGWMGVQVQTVTPAIANSLGMKIAEGAIVDEPQSGSPASKAGLESGDVITAVNSTPIKDSRDLARKIASIAPGTPVTLTVLHKGAEKTVSLTVLKLANESQAQTGSESSQASEGENSQLGMTVAPANEVVRTGSKGVVVTSVDPNGAAAENGLKAGDVILDVSGKPVSNAGDLRKELGQMQSQGKHNVLMRVKSGDATRFVAIPIGHA